MKREIRERAQDAIISAILSGILRERESGNGSEEIALAMEVLATSIARQYGLTRVYGLPATFMNTAA